MRLIYRLFRCTRATVPALLLLAFAPAQASAPFPACPRLNDTSAPRTAPLRISGTPYAIQACSLAEDASHSFPSEIRLLRGGQVAASHTHRSAPSDGYVSRIEIARRSGRFVAVSYDAGEFCNALVFFDLRRNRLAGQLGCVAETHHCRVPRLHGCRADVRCEAVRAEGQPPRGTPIERTLELCGHDDP